MSVYVCVCAAGGRLNGHSRPERRPEIAGYETSSTLMSSELDTTSFFDSEEDDSTSRWETQPFVNNLMTQLLWYESWTSQENLVYSTLHCRADEQTTQICDLDRFHEYIWSSEANKQRNCCTWEYFTLASTETWASFHLPGKALGSLGLCLRIKVHSFNDRSYWYCSACSGCHSHTFYIFFINDTV